MHFSDNFTESGKKAFRILNGYCLVYLDKTHAPLQHQEAFPLSVAGRWHLWILGHPKIHTMLAATLTPHDFCFQSLSIHAPTCAIACNC